MVPSILQPADWLLLEYEPSRSPKGVAVNHVTMSHELQDDPSLDEGRAALAHSLQVWNDYCLDEHGLGIPSVDPDDYRVEVDRSDTWVCTWHVYFRDPARWRDAVADIARAARATADAQL